MGLLVDREERKTVPEGRPRPTRRRFCSIGLLLLLGFLASLAAGVAAADWTYRVRPGDTVWDLSGKYIRHDIP